MSETTFGGAKPPEIPIGGVILFWGSVEIIPAGWEICDGELPKTAGAVLTGLKPNLMDKFVKGARRETRDVRNEVEAGGSHSLNLAHDHTVADHNHGMSHDHGSSKMFAAICQKRVSFGDFNIPHIARDTFTPTNGGTGGDTPSGRNSGNWSGREDRLPSGTAILGNTDPAEKKVTDGASPKTDRQLTELHDNRPEFLSLFYLIRVR